VPESYVQIIKEDDWMESVTCRNSVLSSKTYASTTVESYCERKTARCGKGSTKIRS